MRERHAPVDSQYEPWAPLTRDEAIRRLQDAELEIRSLGVERLALFGSMLRDEAGPESDVDLLVGFAPGTKSFDRLLALSDLLEERLGRRLPGPGSSMCLEAR